MSITGDGGLHGLTVGQLTVLQVRFSDWRSVDLIQLELPSDEQHRAALYKNANAKKRFVICRWVLRQALRELGDPGWNKSFLLQNGKPYLEAGLYFSISHTTDWAVVGVCNGYPIGVDIEYIKPRSNLIGLAEQVFSKAEMAHLRRLDPAEQLGFFYSVWTQKEAIVKAVAGSIYRSYNLTVVPLVSQWRHVTIGNVTMWVQNVQAPDGHRVALAVQRSRGMVKR